MMYGDNILITDINGKIEVESRLDDVYDDRTYIVIDKQVLGEILAKEILEETKGEINIDTVTKKVTRILDDGLKHDLVDYVCYNLRDELEE